MLVKSKCVLNFSLVYDRSQNACFDGDLFDYTHQKKNLSQQIQIENNAKKDGQKIDLNKMSH